MLQDDLAGASPSAGAAAVFFGAFQPRAGDEGRQPGAFGVCIDLSGGNRRDAPGGH